MNGFARIQRAPHHCDLQMPKSPRRLLLVLGLGVAVAQGSDAAPVAADSAIYRCIAAGRVTYQDVPCPVGTRSLVVYMPETADSGAGREPRPARAISADPARSRPTPALRDALARIRVGMSTRDLEALDPRLRTSFTRTLDANGHKHEWRYVSDDCVVHLADGVVVAVFR